MTKDVSSRRGGRNRTKDAPTGEASNRKHAVRTDWAKLRRLSDAEITQRVGSDPDVRATDEEFWKDARAVWPVRKAAVTVRLDIDLLKWFRRERGYQSRINSILRAYMNAHTPDHRA